MQGIPAPRAPSGAFRVFREGIDWLRRCMRPGPDGAGGRPPSRLRGPDGAGLVKGKLPLLTNGHALSVSDTRVGVLNSQGRTVVSFSV